MEAKKICPTNQIEINKSREIILTDSLIFPWKQDRNGYFLVKIDNGMICCGFVNNNHEMIIEFRGKNPDKMIKEIIKRDICDKEHIGYIASELTMAYYCLKNNLRYIQR